MTAVHLALVGKPAPSTHTRLLSGPNPKLAMARALLLKANTAIPVLWEWVKRGAALVTKTPGWVGHAVLGALSTPAGYSTTVTLIGSSVKSAFRLFDRTVCLAGRGIATASGLLASSFTPVAPTWGQALVSAHADAVDLVNVTHEQAVVRLRGFGLQVEQLAHAPLVKAVSTRAAATASALLVVHLITKGVLASKALEVAPSLAGLVVAATSPWWLLVAVAGISVGAIAWAAYASSQGAALEEDLIVNVGVDGSISITGVSSTWSKAEQDRVTGAATEQALAALDLSATRSSSAVPRRRTQSRKPATSTP